MRNHFIEFYQLNTNEIDSIWEKSFFSFDANSLLNLYRYSQNTQKDFIEVLKKISKQIWISYQAGFEYHNNRLSVIANQMNAYKSTIDKINETNNRLITELNTFKRHPYLEIEEIKQTIKKSFDDINKNIEKIQKKHPDYTKKDPVLSKLNVILKGKFGNEFNNEELRKIYKEGSERFENKVPPGYQDKSRKKNNEDNSLYGDLIIWKELITKSKNEKKPIIFITDDKKEDWWHKFNGETIGPRHELIKEFKKETGNLILIYQTDNFIEHAKKKLLGSIKEATIEEIKNIRVEDEKYLKSFLSENAIVHKIDGQNVISFKEDYFKLSAANPVANTILPPKYVVLNPDGTLNYINSDQTISPARFKEINEIQPPFLSLDIEGNEKK